MKNNVFDKKRYEKGLSLIVSFLIIVLTGCRTQYVAMPERHTEYIHDTVLRADSVYVSHYETYHPSPSGEGPGVRLVIDTVLKYLYRDKVVEVIKYDSIPYPVEVPVEVEKPVPRLYRNCTIGFWLIIIGIILVIVTRLYLRR